MDRKSLRKKIAEILKAADSDLFGDNVHVAKSVPTSNKSLPVLLIYSGNAPVERGDESPKTYFINQEIVIECTSEHDTDEELMDELDDLSDEVINIIENDLFLEQECESINLTSVISATDGSGESPAGSAKITYNFEIYFEPRQELVHDDLKALDINWQMNDNENEDTKDTIDLQE